MASSPYTSVFFVRILARPHHDNERYTQVGGAYVNCWITETCEEAALSRAETELRDSAWIPEVIESVSVVTLDTYAGETEGRTYFEQAQIDGLVLVLHTFPNEPAEGETPH